MLPRCRRLGLLVFGVVTLASPAPHGVAAESDAKPNIVLIFADDFGWRDLASNSDGFLETPNLDGLRAAGMWFTNAYAGAANCTPSRACLMSGRYTPRHGVYAVGDTDRGPKSQFRLAPIPNTKHLAPSVVTMAEALQRRGYATAHFGKWHIGSPATQTGPTDQGFDVSPSGSGDTSDADEEKSGRKGSRIDSDPKHVFSTTHSACRFIVRNKSKPFFAYVALHGIHVPLEARATSVQKFEAKAAGFEKPHPSALYAACAYDLDDAIGILLKTLRDEGLEKNTLVIFTSDNGGTPQSVNEPLRGAKGAYYEAGIRVPLLARWPAHVNANTVCDVPVINLDLYPTFVQAAGGRPADSLDGESLMPLFHGEGKLSRSSIYWHFPGYLDGPVPRGRDEVFRTRPVTVVRRGDWKLFVYHEEWLLDGGRDTLATNRAVELYNLRDDIGERNDVANSEPRRRDELLDDLLAWARRTDAKFAAERSPPSAR